MSTLTVSRNMSHYSRNDNPNCHYLSPSLSVSKMYQLYKDKCAVMNEQHVSEWMYRENVLPGPQPLFWKVSTIMFITCTHTHNTHEKHSCYPVWLTLLPLSSLSHTLCLMFYTLLIPCSLQYLYTDPRLIRVRHVTP